MRFWQGGFVADLLIIISLIAVASLIRKNVKPLRTLGVPDALVAGGIGLLLGPTVLGVLNFDGTHLEGLVYHGLALIFITVSLQSGAKGEKTGTARSIAFAIPVTIAMQAVLGLSLVLLWNTVTGSEAAEGLHPGVGLMLPLGFSQGPGTALALGSGWESQGFTNGGQIGLIFAAVGFAWCCVAGVALVAIARRRGWVAEPGSAEDPAVQAMQAAQAAQGGDGANENAAGPKRRTLEVGSLEPLTSQLVAVAVIYLAVYGLLELLTPLAPEKHRNTLWAFHFIFATFLALGTRALLAKVLPPEKNPLDDRLLARMSSLVVDLTTACALAAVNFGVVMAYAGPIMAFTLTGGVLTALWVVWVSRRAFPVLSFHHGIVTFGAMTGTTTTGMALVRMIDPELRTQAARNYVLGSAGAAFLSLPMLAFIPFAVTGWPGTYPTAPLTLIGLLFVYALILVVVWRKTTQLRFLRPLRKFWPERD